MVPPGTRAQNYQVRHGTPKVGTRREADEDICN